MRSKRFVGVISVATVLLMVLAGFAAVPAGAGDEKVTVAIIFDGDIDDKVVRDLGGEMVLKVPYIDGVTADVMRSDIAKLKKDPSVLHVEMDHKATIMKPGKRPPKDEPTVYLPPTPEIQWGVNRIDAELVWDEEGYVGPTDIVVAVLDTGVNMDHPDLADVIFEEGYDFINTDDDPSDDNGHGTHCAGVIAADYGTSITIEDEETYGVVGVAWGVKIMPVKVLNNRGSGSYVAIAAGIEFAAKNGADVISMSLGGTADDDIIHDAITYAIDAGVVASAGNSGKRRTTFDNIGYPAKYPEVIAVGAIDSSDARATFSSTGPSLDVMAPGVGVWSTYEDGQWRSKSGTSMACPHVAGTVALVLAFTTPASEDGWTPELMHAYINTTVEDVGDDGWDNAYGYGIINADIAMG